MTLPGRRSALLVLAIVVLAVALLAGTRTPKGDAQATAIPTDAELDRIQDRVFGEGMRRQGIFVSSGSVEGKGRVRCYSVSLLNPTRANLAYLRQTLGPAVCPESEPGGFAQAGVGCGTGPRTGRTAVVPDVRGLAPHTAARRIEAAGFLTCNASTKRPGRYDAQNALRVVAQCPAAGRRVRLPALVFTQSEGRLPGGFPIYDSADDGRCPRS